MTLYRNAPLHTRIYTYAFICTSVHLHTLSCPPSLQRIWIAVTTRPTTRIVRKSSKNNRAAPLFSSRAAALQRLSLVAAESIESGRGVVSQLIRSHRNRPARFATARKERWRGPGKKRRGSARQRRSNHALVMGHASLRSVRIRQRCGCGPHVSRSAGHEVLVNRTEAQDSTFRCDSFVLRHAHGPHPNSERTGRNANGS